MKEASVFYALTQMFLAAILVYGEKIFSTYYGYRLTSRGNVS